MTLKERPCLDFSTLMSPHPQTSREGHPTLPLPEKIQDSHSQRRLWEPQASGPAGVIGLLFQGYPEMSWHLSHPQHAESEVAVVVAMGREAGRLAQQRGPLGMGMCVQRVSRAVNMNDGHTVQPFLHSHKQERDSDACVEGS